MIVHNVTCNVAPEVENQWLEWVGLHYQITDHNTLENFLNNEDKTLKDRIKMDFGEAVLHFTSQLEIIKKYP